MDGVVLGQHKQSGGPVILANKQRLQGVHCIGLTGMGKTTLLESMMLQDIEAGRGLLFLDPHGDAVDDLLARIPEHRLKDVLLLDAGSRKQRFGLNLYECPDPNDEDQIGKIATDITSIFELIWGAQSDYQSWGPRVAQVMRQAAHVLLANDRYTMVEIPELLVDEDFRTQLLMNVSHPPIRQFWNTTYKAWGKEQSSHTESTINKLDPFLANTYLYYIIGQSRSSTDFRAMMDTNKIVLVKLSSGELGDEAVSLLGAVVVSKVLRAALAREDTPWQERTFFTLYADEYQRFASAAFDRLLAETRKYGVATVFAHQWMYSQLSGRNKAAAMAAVNQIVFRPNPLDAEDIATAFAPKPREGPERLVQVTQPAMRTWVGEEWEPEEAEWEYYAIEKELKAWEDEPRLLASVTGSFSEPHKQVKDMAEYQEITERLQQVCRESGFNPDSWGWTSDIGPYNSVFAPRTEPSLQGKSTIEYHLERSSSPLAPRLLAEVRPLRGNPQASLVWWIQMGKRLLATWEDLERRKAELWACRKEVQKSRYLGYELPVRQQTGSYDRYGQPEDTSTYRKEPGQLESQSDADARFVKELQSLPELEAYCKLQQDKTPIEVPLLIDREWLEHSYPHRRRGIPLEPMGRAKGEIDQEIAARRPEPPPPPRPPISRGGPAY